MTGFGCPLFFSLLKTYGTLEDIKVGLYRDINDRISLSRSTRMQRVLVPNDESEAICSWMNAVNQI